MIDRSVQQPIRGAEPLLDPLGRERILEDLHDVGGSLVAYSMAIRSRVSTKPPSRFFHQANPSIDRRGQQESAGAA